MNSISIKEFQELGYLQEVNRRFFHPLGLAMSVIVDEEKYELGRIVDARKDPCGCEFGYRDRGPEVTTRAAIKANFIDNELIMRKENRIKLFGAVIEPIG